MKNKEHHKMLTKKWIEKNKKHYLENIKRWNKNNPEKVKNFNRVGMWKQQGINITVEQYNKIFKKQKSACKICNVKVKLKALNVDHNHNTGKIRGLLCDKCNKGLGIFNDDFTLIYVAYKYLRKFS